MIAKSGTTPSREWSKFQFALSVCVLQKSGKPTKLLRVRASYFYRNLTHTLRTFLSAFTPKVAKEKHVGKKHSSIPTAMIILNSNNEQRITVTRVHDTACALCSSNKPQIINKPQIEKFNFSKLNH